VLVGANSSVGAPCITGNLGYGVASLQVACQQVVNSSQPALRSEFLSASVWLTSNNCPAGVTPDISYAVIGRLAGGTTNCTLGLLYLFNSSTATTRAIPINVAFTTCIAPNNAAGGMYIWAMNALLLSVITSFILVY